MVILLQKGVMKMEKFLARNFDNPDETKTLPKAKIDIVKSDGYTFSKQTYQPGWRWSQHVKPIAKTDWCEMTHIGVMLSGNLHVLLSNGTEKDIKPGDVVIIPSGHDGWVVGDEPAVFISIEQNK